MIATVEGKVVRVQPAKQPNGKCHFVTLYQETKGSRPELVDVAFPLEVPIPAKDEFLSFQARVDVSQKNPGKLSVFRMTARS